MSPAAARQRRAQQRYRKRRGRGDVSYRIDINECALAQALLAAGMIDDEQALRKNLVQKALKELIDEFIRRWLHEDQRA